LSLSGSGLASFLIGWAKPVPVNPYNLRHRNRDDVLVTLAGPGMNVLLAIALVALARLGVTAGVEPMAEFCLQMAHLSLLLCFFNLIPVPPLDGSHVLRVVTSMSHETFLRFAQWGFVILIVLLQIPHVRMALGLVTGVSFALLTALFGIPFD
jgi:Zn-dependent protease